MKNSPFASICNELATEFDTADIARDINKTRELLKIAKNILNVSGQ